MCPAAIYSYSRSLQVDVKTSMMLILFLSLNVSVELEQYPQVPNAEKCEVHFIPRCKYREKLIRNERTENDVIKTDSLSRSVSCVHSENERKQAFLACDSRSNFHHLAWPSLAVDRARPHTPRRPPNSENKILFRLLGK